MVSVMDAAMGTVMDLLKACVTVSSMVVNTP